MGKGVMTSISPYFSSLILLGLKTVEIRKNKPTISTPFTGYIYCTLNGSNEFFKNACNGDVAEWNRSGIALKKGKVVGEFTCKSIDRLVHCGTSNKDIRLRIVSGNSRKEIDREYLTRCRLSLQDLENYSGGGDLYGWNISDLKIYDKPKELLEFIKPCENDLYCEECAMFRSFEDKCGNSALQIKRPPQSWCYVEELV